jgi:aspartyl-tRNA(Asn)/glutamyl-tRNA(Gln) amidotransferase subunit C
MSEITTDTVKRVAHLARLAIDEAQLPVYTDNIKQILNLVEAIESSSVDSLAPLANPLDATLTLRKDQVTEPDEREALLALAPASEAGLFLVPIVIE